jgi:aspartate racemase
LSEQQVDAKPRQQLVPGLIGMSVHTDCVYLQEINRANPLNSVEPQVSSIKLVLQAIDFGQLVADLNTGRRDEAEVSIRQALAAVQRAGSDFLVVTANTVSAMLEDLADAVSVPVLDITKAVFTEARAQGVSRLGLLSTSHTARSGIYQDAAAEFGCSIITPETGIAEAIDEAIFHRLIRGIRIEQDVATILDAVTWFKSQGADSVILGCTDMTLLADQFTLSPLPLLDSTVLHARAAHYVATTGDLDRYCVRYPAGA